MDTKRDPDDVRMAVPAGVGRFMLGAGAGGIIWWLAFYAAHFDLPEWAYSAPCILAVVLGCGLIGLALPRFGSNAWSGLWKAFREWSWWRD